MKIELRIKDNKQTIYCNGLYGKEEIEHIDEYGNDIDKRVCEILIASIDY